jgi:hypothetical protein
MADSTGAPFVNSEGQLPTYSTTVAAYTAYSTPTDMVVLQNPATSTAVLKVSKIRISGTATATSVFVPYCYIRTALNTGGTSTAVTDCLHDSNTPVSQGSILKYSAAPTLNGTGTLLRADTLLLANATSPVIFTDTLWLFGDLPNSGQVHIRPGQQLSINANSSIPAGASLYLTIQWSESVGFNPAN